MGHPFSCGSKRREDQLELRSAAAVDDNFRADGDLRAGDGSLFAGGSVADDLNVEAGGEYRVSSAEYMLEQL